MIVTLNVHANLIEQHQGKLLLGKDICITNFKIAPKTIMTMENLNVFYQWNNTLAQKTQHIFFKNTTSYHTHQSKDSQKQQNNMYLEQQVKLSPLQKLVTKYTLEIKDGNSKNDKAIVSLFPSKHLDYNRLISFHVLSKSKIKNNVCLH